MISRIQFLPVLLVIFTVFIAVLPFRGRDFLSGNDSNGQSSSLSAVAFPQAQTLLNSEGVRFEVITTEDGLSNNYVTSILQDPDNYHSLRKELVVSLYEDRAGVLWVGTQDGQLNFYDRQSGRFEPDLENLSRGFNTLFILVRCMRILLVHCGTEVMAAD